jgi:hypothetical protein
MIIYHPGMKYFCSLMKAANLKVGHKMLVRRTDITKENKL